MSTPSGTSCPVLPSLTLGWERTGRSHPGRVELNEERATEDKALGKPKGKGVKEANLSVE